MGPLKPSRGLNPGKTRPHELEEGPVAGQATGEVSSPGSLHMREGSPRLTIAPRARPFHLDLHTLRTAVRLFTEALSHLSSLRGLGWRSEPPDRGTIPALNPTNAAAHAITVILQDQFSAEIPNPRTEA